MDNIKIIYDTTIKSDAFKIDNLVVDLDELTEHQQELVQYQTDDLHHWMQDYKIDGQHLLLKILTCETDFLNNRPAPFYNLFCINYERLPPHIVTFTGKPNNPTELNIFFSPQQMKILTKGFGEFKGIFSFQIDLKSTERKYLMKSKCCSAYDEIIKSANSGIVNVLPDEFLIPCPGSLTKGVR